MDSFLANRRRASRGESLSLKSGATRLKGEREMFNLPWSYSERRLGLPVARAVNIFPTKLRKIPRRSLNSRAWSAICITLMTSRRFAHSVWPIRAVFPSLTSPSREPSLLLINAVTRRLSARNMAAFRLCVSRSQKNLMTLR